MRRGRTRVWLTLVLAAVGLLLAIPALWIFVSLTAKPLHSDPASVPTVAGSIPSPASVDAVRNAREIALTHLVRKNLPGLSVAVGIDGDIVWAAGFGFADLKAGVPVTPDHRFRIGTASTVLTSAAAGLLLEKGRLKFDDEIQTYVPAFPRKQWPVTLRELMGHTAGISPDGDDEGPLFTKHCKEPGEALQYFAKNSLLFPPGTQYSYSSYGWILMGAAVEAAAEQPLLPFMRQQIFDPLGMRGTIPDATAAEAGEDFPLANMARELIHDPEATREKTPSSTKKPDQDRVTPYFTRFASNPKYGMHVMRPLDYSCYAGGAGFVSTPSDLVRFGMAMHGGKLLRSATVELLQPQPPASGLGWQVQTVTLAGKQMRVVGQNGDSLGGMVASLLTIPEDGIVVAATSNIDYADTFSLAVKIAEAFAEQAKNTRSK